MYNWIRFLSNFPHTSWFQFVDPEPVFYCPHITKISPYNPPIFFACLHLKHLWTSSLSQKLADNIYTISSLHGTCNYYYPAWRKSSDFCVDPYHLLMPQLTNVALKLYSGHAACFRLFPFFNVFNGMKNFLGSCTIVVYQNSCCIVYRTSWFHIISGDGANYIIHSWLGYLFHISINISKTTISIPNVLWNSLPRDLGKIYDFTTHFFSCFPPRQYMSIWVDRIYLTAFCTTSVLYCAINFVSGYRHTPFWSKI